MVIFDCYTLKFPNTGLYYFCDSLGKSLKKQLGNTGITYFLNKHQAGHFGQECSYIPYNVLYKYIFPLWKTRKSVWHSAFQFPKAMPSKGPVVLTIHDLNFLYEGFDRKTQKKYLSRIQNAVDKASYIIAISEFTKNDILLHLKTHEKPVEVIYNGCNVYSGKISVPAYRPKRPFLYAVGAMLPKKNFHVLPCLLKGNDYELLLSGLSNPDYEARIIYEAQKFGVRNRIHITGPVNEEHKHWYLQHCEAFLFPSVAEGFGLPVLEAMSYGKPVFISRHTSLPEIGRDKACYFDYNFDRDKMVAEFNAGMDNYKSGLLSPEDIKTHATSFSWDRAAEEYIKVYRSLSF